ncbi:MAG: helix-turn-helix domain-containing protein [Burkholderiaceae bacterium]
MAQFSTPVLKGQKQFNPQRAALLSPTTPFVHGKQCPASAIEFVGNSGSSNLTLTSPLLNRKQAAQYLGFAAQTLAQWACSGRVQLPIVKIGGKSMYRKADLDAFITANTYGEQINTLEVSNG